MQKHDTEFRIIIGAIIANGMIAGQVTPHPHGGKALTPEDLAQSSLDRADALIAEGDKRYADKDEDEEKG